MASRRDELNAYTFAKKRLVAQFLQPSPTGTEEGAPRPLRAVVPGVIVGIVIMAGFGAWGMFKPKAPDGWDAPHAKVIIGSESTTRYVVLKTHGHKQLHPVLNLASARLLLTPDQGGEVLKVDEKTLDNGKIPHGATIGIPYAPDRLPDAGEAGGAKRWAVCVRQAQGGRAVQKAAFVFAQRDEHKVEGKNRLRGGELMYVEGPGGELYVVDKSGTKYAVPNSEKLLRILVKNETPQRVSSEWLATLRQGDRIFFPQVAGKVGNSANVPGDLPPDANRVGMVLRAPAGTGMQHYVVLPGRVMRVSDFTARLLLGSPDLVSLEQNGKPKDVSAAAFTLREKKWFGDNKRWPKEVGDKVNSASSGAGARNTVCNVLSNVSARSKPSYSTWAGDGFPARLPTGSTSAYVTPGSGQFFRQVHGTEEDTGGVFLVTDTGLRYAMQSNSDSDQDDSGIGTSRKAKKEEAEQSKGAQVRLGYENVEPAPVPAEWSQFLPTGPRLSTTSARQPQGS